MLDHPQTLIVRHRRENKKKCSLQPIVGRQDCHFFTYPGCSLPHLENHILLGFDGLEISKADCNKGIILIDGTWKRAEIMEKELFDLKKVQVRSLPKNIYTAYPRRQPDCSNPELGLASIEALYVAYWLMERDVSGLLDGYYWKDLFLEKNKDFFK
ncbi:MAG: hypothetical protein S4CHLAM6_01980 [Chlamydiae bacterium]|nr:hypothetical protein [Chlamydiota bacterium]